MVRVTIHGVRDRGKLQRERLLLKAQADLDIGGYAVFDVSVVNGIPTNDIKAAYWFPDKLVRAGDLIVLYTKAGSDTEKQNTDGSTSHFFYWHRMIPAWGAEDDGVALLAISAWKFHAPSAAAQEELPLETDKKKSAP